MVIKIHSMMFRLLVSLPIWLPFGMENVRVGGNTTKYVRVFLGRK